MALRQVDDVDDLSDPLAALRGVEAAFELERLLHRLSHRLPRVQRGERLLEDELHPSPKPTQLVLLEQGDVSPVELDSAGGWLDQAEEAAADSRLPGTAFADEAERLAPSDREGDVVDRCDELPLLQGKVLDERFDAEELVAHRVATALTERRLPVPRAAASRSLVYGCLGALKTST